MLQKLNLSTRQYSSLTQYNCFHTTLTGYTVKIEGPGSPQKIPVMDENATSFEVSDLKPCIPYTFSVSAMTEAGAGPPIIVSSTTPQRGEILCFVHTCISGGSRGGARGASAPPPSAVNLPSSTNLFVGLAIKTLKFYSIFNLFFHKNISNITQKFETLPKRSILLPESSSK